MKKFPKITVYIVNRNYGKYIRQALESVISQTYKNIELIVVDNNSKDKTIEIARKFTNKVFTKGPERSAQRNFGASLSSGEFLLIHDSDIFFNKNTVEECVNLSLKNGYDSIIIPEVSIGEGFWTKVKSFERSFYVGNDFIEASRFFKKTILTGMCEIGNFSINSFSSLGNIQTDCGMVSKLLYALERLRCILLKFRIFRFLNSEKLPGKVLSLLSLSINSSRLNK
jgi:glycosyltransferase involved in cell wall biosynthesis